ncbi:MAG TPA: winged helix-turn-helix domain-containing protein [Candidatus Thermoplasmatota archaeon]|nr:winged helix-turn-helix domain-containing protein [Candidatus Thermoplasmatota archaeon]
MTTPAPSGADDFPIDVDLIKVLASDTRRDVLRLLGERRRTLSELAEAVGLKKATILEHLEKLVAAGLIRRIDDGERIWIYYELTPRGLRIVRPGRSTRFYLLMAGSAAAVVLVGALAAAAMMGGLPSQMASHEGAAGGPQATLADDVRAATPIVVWRGFDENVPITVDAAAAPNATLLLGPLELPVRDGRVVLTGEQIDALPDGRHGMRLRTDAGELWLATMLEARAPPVALAPLAVPEGRASTLVLSVGAPGMPLPTNLGVRVDGEPVPLGEMGRDRTLVVEPGAPGSLDVQVGRLVRMDVRVLPQMTVDAAADNDTLVLNVTDARGRLANVEATLGALVLGATNESGTLVAPWPPAGEHALRLAAPDGRTLERAVAVSEGSFFELPPRLMLQAYADPVSDALFAHVEVLNSGPANETVTLLARIDGQPVASARVEVPANGRAEAPLHAAVPPGAPVTIEAYGARDAGIALGTFQPATLGARYAYDNGSEERPPAASPTPAAAPAAPGHWQGTSMQDESGKSYQMFSLQGRAPDATTTLFPSQPMPTAAAEYAAGQDAAQVPAPSPALLALAAVALALAMGRRRARAR